MLIDLSQIEEPVHQLDVTFTPDEVGLDEEMITLKDDVKLEGSVEKHSYQIDVTANITAAAEINCGRCLIPVESVFEIPFRASYISREYDSPEHGEKEIQIGGDDLDVDFYEDEKIDLTALVHEQIILNVPETTLCKPDCLGLCQKCRANKNEKTCDCSEREIDPRFKVLENLIKEE
jgi:uncharacterized protein